jgi:WD40 repeat protein
MPTKLQVSLVQNYNGHKQSVYCLCNDQNGGFFSGGSDGYVIHWASGNNNEGKLFATAPEAIYCMSLVPNLDMILVGGQSGTLYYLKRGNTPIMQKMHTKGIFGIHVISEDMIITVGGDGVLNVSDWLTRIHKSVKLSTLSLRAIHHSKTNFYIASSDGNIYILNEHFELQESRKAHANSVFTLETVNNHLISAGRDAKLKVWNSEGENTHTLDAHWFTIHAVKSNRAMSFLATTSMDKTIRLWNTHDFSLLKVIDNVKFEGHISSVNDCVWLSDTMFVTCSDDTSIKCWQINEPHKI